MRIVIAGAAGFIGCQLARHYLDEGCDVIAVDNLVTGDMRNIEWLGDSDRFTFIRANVTKPLAVDGDVDLVCDLACPASPVDFASMGLDILRVCSAGVENLLSLARDKEAVFLHTSTSEVYGDPHVHPQTEDYWGNVNPIGFRSVYDEGKRYAEALITAWAKKYGAKVRISRIFNTYGPRMRLDDGRVVTNFICQALANEPLTLHGDGSQTRSFCYIDDQVAGQAALAASNVSTPINIGNPVEITIRQLAEEIIELTTSSSSIIETPMPPDDPKVRCPDITRAKRELAWRPKVDRRDGLSKTIEFCRQKLADGGAG